MTRILSYSDQLFLLRKAVESEKAALIGAVKELSAAVEKLPLDTSNLVGMANRAEYMIDSLVQVVSTAVSAKTLMSVEFETFGLSEEAAASYVGLSRGSFLRRVRDGALPSPIYLGDRFGWIRTELDEALQRAAERR